jgi:hypothetical protein
VNRELELERLGVFLEELERELGPADEQMLSEAETAFSSVEARRRRAGRAGTAAR